MTDLKILSLNCNGFRSHFKQNLIKDFATKIKLIFYFCKKLMLII